MSQEEDEMPITKGDFAVLTKQLSKVEELIKGAPDAELLTKTVGDLKAVSEKMDSLEEAVGKMAGRDEGDDDIGKTIAGAIAPLEKEIAVLKAVPLFKGLQEGTAGVLKVESKDVDVFKGIFGATFPEAGGQ